MKKQSLSQLKNYKKQGQKFATLTAYDATFARLADEAEIECLLVGDSLGNVIQGQRSTVPVSMDEMCYHTAAVTRGATRSFVMTDMPFMSYSTPEQAIANAAELMQAGAQMVKLEGTAWLEDSIYFMSERGVPVCAHLGLLPQSVDKLGGYKVQGKDQESAAKMLQDAQRLEQAGADIILLECIPSTLAKDITNSVDIPVIGIGAGPETDSQVLVVYDALGLSLRLPSFSKNYLNQCSDIQDALATYAKEVKNGLFPNEQFTIS